MKKLICLFIAIIVTCGAFSGCEWKFDKTEESSTVTTTSPTSTTSTIMDPPAEELVFEHGDNFTEKDIEFVRSLHLDFQTSGEPKNYSFDRIVNELINDRGVFYSVMIDIENPYYIGAYIDFDLEENLKFWNSGIIDITKFVWYKFDNPISMSRTVDNLELCFGFEIYNGIIEKDVVTGIDCYQNFVYYFDYNVNGYKPYIYPNMLIYISSSKNTSQHTLVRRNSYDNSSFEVVVNENDEAFLNLYPDILYENGTVAKQEERNHKMLGSFYEALSPYIERLEELDYEFVDPHGETVKSLCVGIPVNDLTNVLFENK